MWTLLLLAATVRSFALMPLRISDRNKMVLWPGCEGRADFSLHTKNMRSVRFVVKRWDVVATSPVVLHWLCDTPWNGICAKNKNMYAWSEQAIVREIAMHDLYCCLLPRCEALRTCCWGFPIASVASSIAKLPDDAFVSGAMADACCMVNLVCLFMKLHLLALLWDDCLDLLRCAFLRKLSRCVKNITAFCQHPLRPIWPLPIYWQNPNIGWSLVSSFAVNIWVSFVISFNQNQENGSLENYICALAVILRQVLTDHVFCTHCMLCLLQSWQFQLTALPGGNMQRA